ncbi:MAG: hypothetical protein RL696_217 [Actinomycetota bacterium]
MKTSERLAGARRVVIKVGSSSITGSNEANPSWQTGNFGIEWSYCHRIAFDWTYR